MLERMGYEDAQSRSSGDVVELANFINDSIPTEWVHKYVEQLRWVAMQEVGVTMRTIQLLRAEFVMDMVKAWRESKK